MTDREKSLSRWTNQQASKDWKEQWWSKDDALGFLSELQTLLENAPEGAKLIASKGLDKEGSEILWLCVEFANGTYSPGFNNSHPCPPFC